jgi:protein-L-isoaspartate(D-aspartate) O-methyltransferase
MMLRGLDLNGSERVLEIGSGSVYEAALLSQLAERVVSLDTSRESAAARLRLLSILGCHNVQVVVGPGGAGWPDEAPYQAILVTGGASRLPVRLLDQLEIGGRLVIPLGDATGQVLELSHKRVDGIVSEALGACHLPMLPWARRPSSFPWAGT